MGLLKQGRSDAKPWARELGSCWMKPADIGRQQSLGGGGAQACRCGSDGIYAGHEVALVPALFPRVPFVLRVPSVDALAGLGDRRPGQRGRRLTPHTVHPVCDSERVSCGVMIRVAMAS